MILIVSGLPGAGKSALVEMLAKKLKLKKVFASDILRKIISKQKIDLNNTKKGTGFFESSEGINISKIRKTNLDFDKKLDLFLLKFIKQHKNIIVDSRTMPWLSNKGFKIWVTATKDIRAKRIAKRDSIPFKKALTLMQKRLNADKKIYKKLYGFDFAKDLSVFDLILDSSSLTKKEMRDKTLKAIKSSTKD